MDFVYLFDPEDAQATIGEKGRSEMEKARTPLEYSAML